MSEKGLKYLIYIWGAVSLFAFVAIRFETLFNAVLKEDVVEGYFDRTKYGEMYYFSMIRHFREEGLPPAKLKFEYSERQAEVNQADVLVFGDSFFEFSRHKQIPERLADDFSKKVHFVNNDYPLTYLTQQNYQDSNPKMVLFERVERYIPIAFETQHTKPLQGDKQSKETTNPLKTIKDIVFYDKSEELYDAMLKRSYLSTGPYSMLVTFKFDLYGNISKMTPAYLKDGTNSWLFYHDQLNDEKTSFYYQHSDEQIDSICNNMAHLSEDLKENFNLSLLYLPLPAKYTMYHELINNDSYNDFLPRLYAGLDERGVSYVNVYDDFVKSDTPLYYRTDSHWNQKGIDMAYSKTVDYINNDSILSNLLKNP